MWIVDTFACMTPGSLDVHDLPRDFVAENMPAMNSLVSPWHAVARPDQVPRHVDAVEAMGVMTVATAARSGADR